MRRVFKHFNSTNEFTISYGFSGGEGWDEFARRIACDELGYYNEDSVTDDEMRMVDVEEDAETGDTYITFQGRRIGTYEVLS